MAATDVLTIAEAKTAVNYDQSTTNHDDELGLWVTAVSTKLDRLCGPVVIRTVTDETHDGGLGHIRLREAPESRTSATTVTSVTEYDGTTSTVLTAETNASKPADGFLFDSTTGTIYRRSSGADGSFPSGRRNVLVTYQAGRYAGTASVDSLFKMAAGSVLRRLWKREQGAWSTGGNPFEEVGSGGTVGFFKAVAPTVLELLSDEMRGPVVG